MTGSASFGAGGVGIGFSPPASRRRRTFAWARIGASGPNFAFPPVWSPCQWVFRMNLSFPSPSVLSAARIFSASGANWSSTIRIPSGPTETPMFPPAPSSMWTAPATWVALISTFERSCCVAGGPPAWRKKRAGSARLIGGSLERVRRGLGGRVRRLERGTGEGLPERRREGGGADEGEGRRGLGRAAERLAPRGVPVRLERD